MYYIILLQWPDPLTQFARMVSKSGRIKKINKKKAYHLAVGECMNKGNPFGASTMPQGNVCSENLHFNRY